MSEVTEPLLMEGVLYCDGGCRSAQPGQSASRGHAGWGIHGYFFTREVPKVGAGAKKGVPSPKGYDLKATGKGTVTVHKYVDAFESLPGENTNNIAEVAAATRAIEIATRHSLAKLTILTDSKYVVDGIGSWLAGWIRNNWMKSTGQPIENREYWRQLNDALQHFKTLGGELKAEWVRGHNGEPGNELADKLATRGAIAAKHGKHVKHENVSDAKGYWKRNHEPPRMLNMANWYFTTSPMMDTRTKDGRAIYYLGDIRDSEEFFGKPISNATLAVVYLNEPMDLLEKMRGHFIELSKGTLKGLISAPLRDIFAADMMDALMEHGDKLMVFHPQRQAIEHMDRRKEGDADGIELGHEIRPTRLAFNAVNLLENLEAVLNETLVPPPTSRLVKSDVTDVIYERHENGKKITVKLAAAISTSTSSVTVPVSFRQGEATGSKSVCFTLGQDLPDRNTLAALASETTRVTVVTWLESPLAFRFATVIETEDGVGIWAGPYSNLQLVPES